MTAVETLRAAAKLMRERAEALSFDVRGTCQCRNHSALTHSGHCCLSGPCAHDALAPSPWTAHPATDGNPADGPTTMRVSDAEHEAIAELPYDQFGGMAAIHIAALDPAVALALADLLDAESWLTPMIGHGGVELFGPSPLALTVARAYLRQNK